MLILVGRFYEFHRERVVSPPGAPVVTRPGMEIGPEIPREMAVRRVRAGNDVYTPARGDAKQLATRLANGGPVDELPHRPECPTPSGREDIYYRHFHPGGLHPGEGGPGHVFYGRRGERYAERTARD